MLKISRNYNTKTAAAMMIVFSVIFAGGCGDRSTQPGSQVTQSIKKDLNRARFTEIIIQAESLKRDIALCLENSQFNIDSNDCNSGARGPGYSIPQKYSTAYFDSVEVKLGSIIVTAGHNDTLNGETYILDPEFVNNQVMWRLADDSTCITAGYC
jgi:hypothetical protein